MKNFYVLLILIFSSFLFCKVVEAEYSISLIGKEESMVNAPVIRLADIAEVSAVSLRDDEAVIALGKIVLADSPTFGGVKNLQAKEILQRLKEEGLDLTKIGYVLPPVTKVRRASRSITEHEVRSAIETFLMSLGREIVLRNFTFAKDFKVTPGENSLKTVAFNSKGPGRMDFRIEVGEGSFLDAQAQVEEWKEVPVAKQSLSKGSVIKWDDMMMAKLNIASLIPEVPQLREEMMGLKLTRDIEAGEAFRRSNLFIPPLIEVGTKVNIIYQRGPLRASATGTAIEAGANNDLIRVRNENSKKILTGKVIEAGLVEVSS